MNTGTYLLFLLLEIIDSHGDLIKLQFLLYLMVHFKARIGLVKLELIPNLYLTLFLAEINNQVVQFLNKFGFIGKLW